MSRFSTINDPETCPCRICGNPTPMLGTKLCDRCWELEGRIKRDWELAEKIMGLPEIKAITKQRDENWAMLQSCEEALKWYAGMLRPEDRLDDNGERAEKALVGINSAVGSVWLVLNGADYEGSTVEGSTVVAVLSTKEAADKLAEQMRTREYPPDYVDVTEWKIGEIRPI